MTPPEVKKFVRLFLDVDVKAAEPFEELASALNKLSVENIVPLRAVMPMVGHVGSEEVRDSRKAAKRTFYRAIESARTVMLSARDRRPVDIRKAKRAVQGIVDLITRKAYMGDKGTEADPPADLGDAIEGGGAQLSAAPW